jgi:hypothetical protein
MIYLFITKITEELDMSLLAFVLSRLLLIDNDIRCNQTTE